MFITPSAPDRFQPTNRQSRLRVLHTNYYHMTATPWRMTGPTVAGASPSATYFAWPAYSSSVLLCTPDRANPRTYVRTIAPYTVVQVPKITSLRDRRGSLDSQRPHLTEPLRSRVRKLPLASPFDAIRRRQLCEWWATMMPDGVISEVYKLGRIVFIA